MRTSRLEAFSDGVLAIIITIMVLQLREPTHSQLSDLVRAAGIGLLSYLLSFVYVGIYWTNHHHMFQLTRRVTGGVLWANLGLLFCLSLFPFTTQWVDDTHWARAPVVVYGLNLLAAAIAYYVLQSVIIRSQGKDSPLRDAVGLDRKGRVTPAAYIIGCVAALVGGGTGAARPGMWIAVACFVGAAAVWVIPDRRIETVIDASLAPGEPGERDGEPGEHNGEPEGALRSR
jgi:uncharacterized membrane protein